MGGKDRVRQNLRNCGLWEDHFDLGLAVVCGSLGVARFGLSETEFNALACNVASIIHLGAKVDLQANLNSHRSANIGGTISVLRLAFRAGCARTVFVSTTDVLERNCGDEEPSSSELLLPAETPHGEPVGYMLSKIVGERLVDEARKRGLSTVVCRLGMVGGSSKDGTCNPKDFLCRLLVGFAHTRSFPETDE